MFGKAVVSAISVILVVGIVLGVVTTVKKKDENLSPQMKSFSQFCSPTEYKDVCVDSLRSTNNTDPKELIKSSMISISKSLKQTFNLSKDLVVEAKHGTRDKLALDDCKELLDEADQQLQATFTTIGDSDLHTIANRSDDLRIWLSSIISYQELCIDNFEDNSEFRASMRESTDYGNKLTDNVLNVLGDISKVLNSFGLQLNFNVTSRRLLQDKVYPEWMSAADRKLLAAKTIKANNPKPNAIVALDGSGQYKSIQAAVNAYPNNLQGRFVIYVKSGTYKEYVTITKKQKNIYMYGDGARKTIVTGSKSYAKSGINTWKTATVVVEANGFIAKNMAFTNTAGPEGHQAVAIRVNSDASSFYNVRFDGYQDTLLYQSGRQFYRNCVISGTVDFMFGYGAAVIQNTLIIVRKPMDNQFCTVTADGRKTNGQPTGIVIHNCRIVPEQKLVPQRLTVRTYLGRPWKDYSRTVVMESQLGDLIQPEGWQPWTGDMFLNTLYYAEYANRGPGANTARRVKWKTLYFLNKQEALQFTPGAFLGAKEWVPSTGAPMIAGLRK